MPLSWNEIKGDALAFSKERRRLATFEQLVKTIGNKQEYIDLFWKESTTL